MTSIGKIGTALAVCLLAAPLMAGNALAGSGSTTDVQLAAADAPEAKKKKKKKHPGKRIYGPRGGFGCIACHGRNGKLAIQDYPNIAGQDEKYMVQQIKDIQSGKRVGGLNKEGKARSAGMHGALITPDGKPRMTEEQMKQVANWLAGIEPAKPVAPEQPYDEARIKEGKKLYKKRKCMSCHGKDGKKPQKKYPYVAGQKKAYIVLQMQDIRDKKRTNGKSKLMYASIKKLKDDEIEKIAEYLSQIDRTKK